MSEHTSIGEVLITHNTHVRYMRKKKIFIMKIRLFKYTENFTTKK